MFRDGCLIFFKIFITVLLQCKIHFLHLYFDICPLSCVLLSIRKSCLVWYLIDYIFLLNFKLYMVFMFWLCEWYCNRFSPGNSYRDILHCEKKPFYHKGLEEDSNIMDAYLIHSVRTCCPLLLCDFFCAFMLDFWVTCFFGWLNKISCSSITFSELEILWERMMQKSASIRRVQRVIYFQVMVLLIKGLLVPRYISQRLIYEHIIF